MLLEATCLRRLKQLSGMDTSRGHRDSRSRRDFRYRIGGESAWMEGTTINISRSGILFRAQKEIAPRTMLQMRIVFPSELTGYGPVSIVVLGAGRT